MNIAAGMGKPDVRVLELPPGLETDEVERRINEPLQGETYYFAAIVPYGAGALVIYRIKADERVRPDEDKALKLLAENRGTALAVMVEILRRHGITRNNSWVTAQRAFLEPEDKPKPAARPLVDIAGKR